MMIMATVGCNDDDDDDFPVVVYNVQGETVL